jgi:hypothetical protein
MAKQAHVWVVERLDDLGKWYCFSAYDMKRDATQCLKWITTGNSRSRYRIRKYVRSES